MPWYPDHYEHDDDPNEQYNSWDDMQDDNYCEEELIHPGYPPDNPLAGYDPDRMWGGSDMISITAMWAGDLSAEMYCYDKSFRLGGFPWDEGVWVHPSYYGKPQGSVNPKHVMSGVLIFTALVVAVIICQAFG